MSEVFNSKIFNGEIFQKYVDRIPNTKLNELIKYNVEDALLTASIK